MNISLVKRLLDALGYAVTNFIIACIIWGKFFYKEDWLLMSLFWSASWATGRFFAKSIANMNMNKKYKIILYVLMCTIALIHGLVILKVLLKISQWKNLFIITVIPFILGLSFTKVNLVKD